MHERGIVARPVCFAISRCAVVLGTCGECRFVELLNLRFVFCLKSYVHWNYAFCVRPDPEISILAVIESSRFAVLHIILIPEGGEHFGVERFCFLIITDWDAGVCNHIKSTCNS